MKFPKDLESFVSKNMPEPWVMIMPSGIELPGELAGLIPDPTWKRIFQGENWSTGDTYLASVGQGYVLATPLQVLLSAATIANDGKLMQPTVIYEIQDELGNIIDPFNPRMRWDITRDALIRDFQCEDGYCEETGSMKIVEPWVVTGCSIGNATGSDGFPGNIKSRFFISKFSHCHCWKNRNS